MGHPGSGAVSEQIKGSGIRRPPEQARNLFTPNANGDFLRIHELLLPPRTILVNPSFTQIERRIFDICCAWRVRG
jgi:hypothetical protein